MKTAYQHTKKGQSCFLRAGLLMLLGFVLQRIRLGCQTGKHQEKGNQQKLQCR